MYKRSQFYELKSRIQEERYKIQVVTGPRQVGKSTMVRQVLEDVDIPHLSVSADGVDKDNKGWISEIWQSARSIMEIGHHKQFILALDEIHKINNWSEMVKKEWDKDTMDHIDIKVILLGSSRLLIKDGLTESLAGRYELIRMGYWSYDEMHDAFDVTLNQFIYFGGYPGAVRFYGKETRWRRYIMDGIIDPIINLDIRTTKIIYKPELMKRLLETGCLYSGKEISLTKLLGQLQEKGNVTTLASYLTTLNEAEILCGLQKYANDECRKYNSIPKLCVYNTGLLSALSGRSFENVFTSPQDWGRWVESAVGAHLLGKAEEEDYRVYYWRYNKLEVDFIIERNRQLVAIEVKSGMETTNSGLQVFNDKFHPHRSLIVAPNGLPIEEFLRINPATLFDS